MAKYRDQRLKRTIGRYLSANRPGVAGDLLGAAGLTILGAVAGQLVGKVPAI